MTALSINEADWLVEEAHAEIDLYSRIAPVNEQGERERFMEHGEEPDFEYDTDVELDGIKQQLEQAELPDDLDPAIQDLYERTIEEYRLQADIVENIGDPDVVEDATAQIFGTPRAGTVEEAKTILQNDTGAKDGDAQYSADELQQRFEKVLDNLGLDWAVEQVDKGSVSVKPSERTMRVPDSQGYTENEFQRLPVHEIGVHALRAANGYQQPFDILGTGAAGYSRIEEGLALYLEEQAGLRDEQTLENYAARVVATQSRIDGDSFEETYEMLRCHDMDENTAWRTTVRAHRAGGFAKDHIYLQGYLKVKDYLDEDGNSLDGLYIGRVSIEDAEQLDELDEIEKPEYRPEELI